jgi:DNA adenine methylase
MRYVGSKNRFKKEIAPILQNIIDNNNIKSYYEPFVGGCNMIDVIQCEKRVGNDMHTYLIDMWKALQSGWKPPIHITEDEYYKVKNNKNEYSSYYVGLVGFAASYGAKWFGGYARGFKSDGITPRDMPNEGIRNILRQVDKIKDVKFISGDYKEITPIDKLNGWLIYCDPPYKGTTRYSENINHDIFWKWCEKIGKNNIIIVSEYSAPDGWVCIWSKDTTTSLKTGAHSKRTEKLWQYKGVDI